MSGKAGTFIVGAVVGILLIAVVFGGEAAVSRTEFCISCHSEIYPYEELKKSSHWGALGADPGCKDCHVPQGFWNFHKAIYTHVVDGGPFLIKEFTTDYSTVEKFNEHRPEAAFRARMKLKEWDSLTCRACHKNVKAPAHQPRLRMRKCRPKAPRVSIAIRTWCTKKCPSTI